jgi:6-pyruvoyltetrahydropterin/6-carboxytetrahydropterin synthase
MSGHAVIVRHNFETAHRLPHIGGKCVNLHGHSWWAEVTVTSGGLSGAGTVVEFGAFKRALRGWLDAYLDHGALLGVADPLRAALDRQGCRVFVFGAGDTGATPAVDVSDLAWPTVENVAVLLGRVGGTLLGGLPSAAGASVSRVVVSETHVNAAEWFP